MSLYEKLMHREEKIALIGLGYVGLPIAVSFSQWVDVIGFDTNPEKIAAYVRGEDPTGEVGAEAVRNCKVAFTSEEARLSEAGFYIVAVPTPVQTDHTPDLNPVREASRLVGRNLREGAVVVYESTVFPGVTEELCVPILEAESGLRCGRDFHVGYSPERINPGDPVHRLDTIVKIVAGQDASTLEVVARVYELVAKAGVYRAESIAVAEAAKVIENSQRDINIAFMNELALIFHRMGIDTKAVLEAAATKWNFLSFSPGLVGGHCIGVDPYYLTYRAEQLGYHSQIILAGRRINDGMGKYVAECIVKGLIRASVPVKGARVGILGFTFKENCPDTRNTRVIDVVRELEEYGIQPQVVDPRADAEEVKREYGISLVAQEALSKQDAVLLAVAHAEFQDLTQKQLEGCYERTSSKLLFDLKGICDRESYERAGYQYWRL